jgi:hypothetical protein
MKRTIGVSIIGVAAIMTAMWAAAQIATLAPSGRPLANWMPGGALLYLESPDFGTELRDWNRSAVKSKWLASKNYEAFHTTRLVLKLQDVYAEFSAAAGLAPNLNTLEGIAGTETALALYDVRNLDFVYISRLPGPSLAQNVFNLVRVGYQTRTAGGVSYFIRQSGARTAVFAIAGEYVVMSTRENLMSSALELIRGDAGSSIGRATWYRDAVQALPSDAARPPLLRLVMDLPAVIATPYFRSYWIQKNTGDFRQYYAFLSQVTRNAGALEENRVLLRMDAVDVPGHEAAAAELQRYIPDDAGFFRLWDSASPEFVMNLIQEKFFAAGAARSSSVQSAPAVVSNGAVGLESDVQTRIDAAPKPSLTGALNLVPLRVVMDSAQVEALLHLETNMPLAGANDSTYPRSDAVIAVSAASSWNAASVQSALTSAVASYQTVANIGLQWRPVDSGSYVLSQWDGLVPLTIYIDGQTLWIARTPSLLSAALQHAASAAAPAQPASYIARHRHQAELAGYLKIMRMLDLSDPSNFSGFFSENVGSLASTLDVIDSASIARTDTGRIRRETVRYTLAK